MNAERGAENIQHPMGTLNLEQSPLNTLNRLKEMHSVALAAFEVFGRELRGKSRN